jgi:hypothetical protein
MAEFNLWLLIVGIAAGAAVMWLVIGTLARNDDEESAEERELEAAWIADTIEEHGGRAPATLVEQILALHRRYLQGGPGIPVPVGEPDEADSTAAAEADAEEAEAVSPTGEPELASEAAGDDGSAAAAPGQAEPLERQPPSPHARPTSKTEATAR